MIRSISYRIPRDPQVDQVVEKHVEKLGPQPEAEPSGQDMLSFDGLATDCRPLRVIQSLVWPPVNGISRFFQDLPADHGLLKRLTGYGYVAACRRIYEILNLSDGTRTWQDIFRMVDGQFDGTTAEDFAELASLLCSSGAIEETGGATQ